MSVVVDEPGDAYALGIDVGTSSVKIAVVRREEAAVQTAFHTEKNTDASYSLGRQVVKQVLKNVFREFHRLLGCTAAAVLPNEARRTFKKHFTKPFYKLPPQTVCSLS